MEQLDPEQGDVAEDVSRLKPQPGKDILIFGSGNLVNLDRRDRCRNS
jgi:hypothetical protein